MKTKMFKITMVLFLFTIIACSQTNKGAQTISHQEIVTVAEKSAVPHRYGGWYCPDNLNGFPATDIGQWEKVPVVNGRMATKEETRNGSSLIFVDIEKYPNAKPLDIQMPKLANFFNRSSNRTELIIVIQALNIDNDSIVGFRYLNGGNGSARLKEIRFLTDNEIEMLPKTKFVSHSIIIKQNPKEIWEIITQFKYSKTLQKIYDKDGQLTADWMKISNVNFHYAKSGLLKAKYAEKLFGNYYIQNDFENLGYNEKFLLLENKETQTTELKIVCGPFAEDYEIQKNIINKWSQKVKSMSEKQK